MGMHSWGALYFQSFGKDFLEDVSSKQEVNT